MTAWFPWLTKWWYSNTTPKILTQHEFSKFLEHFFVDSERVFPDNRAFGDVIRGRPRAEQAFWLSVCGSGTEITLGVVNSSLRLRGPDVTYVWSAQVIPRIHEVYDFGIRFTYLQPPLTTPRQALTLWVLHEELSPHHATQRAFFDRLLTARTDLQIHQAQHVLAVFVFVAVLPAHSPEIEHAARQLGIFVRQWSEYRDAVLSGSCAQNVWHRDERVFR